MAKLFDIIDPMAGKKTDAEQLAKYYYLYRSSDVVDKALRDVVFELYLATKGEVECKYEKFVDVYRNDDIIYVEIGNDTFEYPYNSSTFKL